MTSRRHDTIPGLDNGRCRFAQPALHYFVNGPVAEAVGALLGFSVYGAVNLDGSGDLSGVEANVSKGINTGIDVQADVASFYCYLKTGCTGDTR